MSGKETEETAEGAILDNQQSRPFGEINPSFFSTTSRLSERTELHSCSSPIQMRSIVRSNLLVYNFGHQIMTLENRQGMLIYLLAEIQTSKLCRLEAEISTWQQ